MYQVNVSRYRICSKDLLICSRLSVQLRIKGLMGFIPGYKTPASSVTLKPHPHLYSCHIKTLTPL